MAFDQKDNSGSIFANDKKESANHPDGKGSAMIGGVEYWVSSWNKKTKDGKPWRSLSFSPKDSKKPTKQESKSSGFDDMDSDVPF